ncbi:MAG: N-acetylmuramoyl-L-alanine amidase [Saprospiraceae bacterium]|nr:N-acetylmuramoyl-L-alanine amidase [Saprospiraceae bacterium]
MRAINIVLIILLCPLFLAADSYYHSVKAVKGDGIYSLLRRYHLNDHNCNRQQFLQLNKMTINDPLVVGRSYKIPVLIFDYNGTSIRTTIGINNWDKAVRIQKYNETVLTKNLRKSTYKDSRILWVPYHELYCDESLPEKVEKVAPKKPVAYKGSYQHVPLFGEKESMVPIKDNNLANKVYYIVAGHGGPDPGARCTECSNTLCEDEYAYDVCLRLARELISHGAKVHVVIEDKNDGIRDDEYLECDTDEKCMGAKIPLSQKTRLKQRASAINNLYYKYKKRGITEQVAIMVHVDSYNDEKRRQDVYFYHHKSSKSSKRLAESLHNTFKEKYNYYQKNRGYKGFVKSRGLYMLNFTQPTSVYVELANIRNSADQERLIKASNREALAKWLYEGMTSF